MPEPPVQVAVLVCCYNSREHLPELLESLARSDDGNLDVRIVLVDNGSSDGSSEFVRANFPDVECVRLESNRGFAGGNNAGHEHVRRCHPAARYLALLNADTIVESGWLRGLVDALEADSAVVAAQPTLVLHPDIERINTVGNRSHYLGFGMMGGYGRPRGYAEEAPTEMDFPSGAAVLLRMDTIERVGLFDEVFHMYLEDADLGWKLRQLGGIVRHVPGGVVRHKYQPHAPDRHYRPLERNRWLLLLTYYKWPTLALLAPALLTMELGQVAYATGRGLLGQKVMSWLDLLRPRTLATLRRRRRAARERRVVTDRHFTARFTGRVHLPVGDPWLLRWVANPMFEAYWRAVRPLIRW